MSKFLFTVVSCFICTSLNAQENNQYGNFNVGDVYVSGILSYTSTSFNDDSDVDFRFAPSLGYLIRPNIALQFSFIYDSYSSEILYETEGDFYGIGFGIRHFLTPEKRFTLTNSISVSSLQTDNEEYKINTIGFSISPGFNYFVSEKFALNASIAPISYIISKPDVKDAESTTFFSFDLNLSNINFGLLYKF